MVHLSRRARALAQIAKFLPQVMSVPERLRAQYIRTKQDVRAKLQRGQIDTSAENLFGTVAQLVTLWEVNRKDGARVDQMYLLQAEILAYIAIMRERIKAQQEQPEPALVA